MHDHLQVFTAIGLGLGLAVAVVQGAVAQQNPVTAIDIALEKYTPRLRMLGYLVTLRQRLALHDAYEKQLRSLYGDLVFDAPFPLRKDFKEAIAERTPIHFLRLQHLDHRADAPDVAEGILELA